MMNINKYGYYNMVDIIKPCEKGRFQIKHYSATPEQVLEHKAHWDKIGIDSITHGLDKLVVLYDNDITRRHGNNLYSVVMSSDTIEHQSCKVFNDSAYGDVMIAGLGIGMVIIPLLHNPKVTRITVYEKYQNIIDMVKPQLDAYIEKNNLTNNLHIICRDINNPDYSLPQHNVIWIDIWNEMSSPKRQRDMKLLIRKYRKQLKKKGVIKWWGEEEYYNDRVDV